MFNDDTNFDQISNIRDSALLLTVDYMYPFCHISITVTYPLWISKIWDSDFFLLIVGSFYGHLKIK